jgi:hypothetical protein
MNERQLSQEGELRIVTEIGRELARVQALEANRSRLGLRAARRRRATTAAAVAAALITTTAAAAATGVLEVGSVIPGGAPTGDSERADETVVATGTTLVAGPWRMTTYTSKASHTDDGEEIQGGGLPCLRLMLTEAVTPLSGSGWCGQTTREFIVSALPVTTPGGQAELILFGVAPEAATAVQLTAADGKQVRVRTHERGRNVFGEPWVIAAPLGLGNPEVTWLDERGQPRGNERDVSSEFDRGAALRRTLENSKQADDE